MAGLVDLRSDTVTRPTPEMRKAMAYADVGDDVYGEDPTVKKLEQRVAELLGTEAALFVPTGTMANQIALRSHTRPGDEVIIGFGAHCWRHESGALAALGGLQTQTLGVDGMFTAAEVRAAFKAEDPYQAATKVVAIENTHNMAGGTVTPLPVLEEIWDGAKKAGLPVHLDGARIFNASVALGVPVRELTSGFSTVMFCLSKGLCAPAGSMIVGSRDLIDKARIYRKALGGGMRQAGVIAAAGLVALRNSPRRLHIDHENARFLAEGIAQIPQMSIDPAKVRTNIVICDCSKTGKTAVEFCEELYAHGIWAQDTALHSVRFVTHCDVDRAGMERALPLIRQVASNTKKAKA